MGGPVRGTRLGSTIVARRGRSDGASHGLASLYWRGTGELLGRDMLVFTTDAKLGDELRPLFESIEEETPFATQHNGEAMQTWRFFRCHHLLRPAPAFTRLPAE